MQAHQALAEHGTKAAAARALNLPVSTFKSRLDAEQRRSGHTAAILEFPQLPDQNEPIDRLLSRRMEHYQRKRAHHEAAHWQQVKVTENKPFGLALLGDPHIDDDGCNLPRLMSDIDILKATDGLYAVNIGDTTNNWVGRLARLFGNQETSQTSARQMAEWFLLNAGVRWAAVLIGNHDEWNEGGEIIRRMCAAAKVTIPVHEWAAKIEFVFPNGATCRASLAHDFKGRSIYSTTHGPLRESIWHQEGAHILAAGHIHYGGLQQIELPGGHNPWLVRVRGYKEYDAHALVNGFHEGNRFPAVMAIIDPNAAPEDRVLMFGSLKQGAEVLNAMRAAHGAQAGKGARRRAQGRSGEGAPRPSSVRRTGGSREGSDPRRSKIRGQKLADGHGVEPAHRGSVPPPVRVRKGRGS